MSGVDVFLCAVLVAFAASYIAWRLLRKDRSPACHPPAQPGNDIVIKGALARGLSKAQRKSKPHR